VGFGWLSTFGRRWTLAQGCIQGPTGKCCEDWDIPVEVVLNRTPHVYFVRRSEATTTADTACEK
jgi:hypothetical protein